MRSTLNLATGPALKVVAQLKDTISTALDCDTEGADCTAKLGSLPTCDARVLSDEFSWPGDHGKDVPVGVVATRQCPKARFVPADRSTVTCQATGWTKVGAECASCPEDCDACSGKETCTQCSRGFDLSFNIAASKYSQVSRNKQPPLATENLLENTGGVGAPHQCSLGAAAFDLLFMLTRAIY